MCPAGNTLVSPLEWLIHKAFAVRLRRHNFPQLALMAGRLKNNWKNVCCLIKTQFSTTTMLFQPEWRMLYVRDGPQGTWVYYRLGTPILDNIADLAPTICGLGYFCPHVTPASPVSLHCPATKVRGEYLKSVWRTQGQHVLPIVFYHILEFIEMTDVSYSGR